MWSLIQFGLSCAYGGVVYLALADDPNPRVPLYGGLMAGFAGAWLTMFLLAWLRFGWQAARSMRMNPLSDAEIDAMNLALKPGDKRVRAYLLGRRQNGLTARPGK